RSLVSRVFATVVFPVPENPSFALVETHQDLDFLLTDTGLKPGTANPGPLDATDTLRPLIPLAVDQAAQSMKLILDQQERTATERLEQWRARADRWYAAADQLDLFGSQKSKVDKLSRRI